MFRPVTSIERMRSKLSDIAVQSMEIFSSSQRYAYCLLPPKSYVFTSAVIIYEGWLVDCLEFDIWACLKVR